MARLDFLRLKVPPLLLALVFIAAMWGLSFVVPTSQGSSIWMHLLALATFAVGACFCTAGIVEFRRRRTTVDPRFPDRSSAMVCSGVYSISRNPMYVGFLLFILSACFAFHTPILSVFAVLFVAYMNRFQIAPEEEALTRKFGSAYTGYASKVRRWI